jgi:hypothetical protein
MSHRLEHFPAKPAPDLIRGGNRFAEENATTQEQPERIPIPLEQNSL